MRVGIDTYTLQGMKLSAFETLAFARAHELDGVQFGSALAISPTLDPGALREFRAEADRLGRYLEVGISSVNPYRFPGNSAVTTLGDGEPRRGGERLIHAARSLGCTELHSTIGLLGDRLATPEWVRHADERGRLRREPAAETRLNPPVAWSEQLRATTDYLRELRPLLRDLGARVDLETHADVTTFELVRIVEEVGDDVVGITLDTANTMNQLEDPLAAARRAAPYVHLTHAKDGLIFFDEHGLAWQPRPCGDGSMPWPEVLTALGRYAPNLTLSIEDHKWIYELPIDDPTFLADHPELTPVELARLVGLARSGQRRIDRGETPRPEEYELTPWAEQQLARIDAARSYLKDLLSRLGLGSTIKDAEVSHD